MKQTVSCPCGSDASYKKCCGKRSQSKADKKRISAKVPLLFSDAVIAHQENRYVHCLTAVKAILEEEPFHLGALRLLSMISGHSQIFNAEELQQIAENILEGYPEEPDLVSSVGDLYESLGNAEQASRIFQQILKDSPQHFRSHFGLARLAQNHQQLHAAEYHYRLAHYAQQHAPMVLANLGAVLSALGRKTEAEYYFKIALAQLPGNVPCLINWSRMEESRGNMEKAWDLYHFAKEQPQSGSGLKIHEALLHRRTKNYKKAITVLDGVDQQQTGSPGYWFERSMVLDKMQLFDQAFECAQRANGIKVQMTGSKYDQQKMAEMVKAMKSGFTKAKLKSIEPAQPLDSMEEQPTFICGFTRSGTSMVEQILSAHSNICGGDELPFIYDLAANAPKLLGSDHDYPKCLTDKNIAIQNRTSTQALRAQYLNRFRLTPTLEPRIRRFTDKMPMNEMHIGLMQLIFPESHIIHVFRHPLDSVLSTYFIDASHGSHCGYDLESAARHYRLLFELTEYYLDKMVVNYLRIRYEDIVGNIKKETRAMLKFLGEPFQSQCVDFHTNPRYARTASYAQVTEKLYKTSMYRYRNYEKHLQSIIPILEPVIKKLGYSV